VDETTATTTQIEKMPTAPAAEGPNYVLIAFENPQKRVAIAYPNVEAI
jgi:hypothetical protein